MKKFVSMALVVLMLVGCVGLFASCADKDEAKYKIGAQSGTTGECFVKGDAGWGFEGFENLDVASYDTAALAVKDMENGKVDFVIIDAEVGKSLAAGNDKIKVIDFALTTEAYGFAVDKNQADLLAAFNTFLAENAEEIAEIYEDYADVTDENSTNWTGTTYPAGTIDSSKNQLVIATNAAFAPYEFTVGNSFAGIDLEICKMFADSQGMEMVIVDMAFEAVVTSVGKNGIDIGASGLTINETRKKVVNFTNPYETGAYQLLLAMKDDTTFDECKSAEDVLAKLKALAK